jgi:hypothetical protein
MPVDFYAAVSWGPFTNAGPEQKHHALIPFSGAPHVMGTAYLAEVSRGELDYTAGVALACFASYAYQDPDGRVLTHDISPVASNIEVENCVSITIALDVVAATAMGGWTFYLVT